MTEWVPIVYGGFWDVPRIFFATWKGQLYLFDCPFDEDLDDYPDFYTVYLMPPMSPAEYAVPAADLLKRTIRTVANVSLAAVRFDPTRRAAVGAELFDFLPLLAPPANSGPGRHAGTTGLTRPSG